MTITARELLITVLTRACKSEIYIGNRLTQYNQGLPVVWTNRKGESFSFQYGYGVKRMVEQPLTEDLIKEIEGDEA